MTWSDYTTFLVFALLIALAPGPDTLVVLKNGLAGGFRAGLATIFGITTGCLIQGTAVGLGLGAFVVRYHVVFEVIRWSGVVYLCYLGFQAFRAAKRGDYATVDVQQKSARLWRRWTEGFLTNITNPKVLVFFLSVLPQFLDPATATTLDALVLAYTVVAAGVTWQLAVLIGVHKVRSWISRTRVRRAIDAVTGTALIGFGVALATE
ncbi:LysE family translocator [Thermocrispum municipale]|jgi:RhtB (resistance to homoserine/threonine) family protein|uniref:LysE family translocator n=1 Tax=Thermocrispum municipale TaxID=37926 RepID=UPI000410B9AB|nr:LysE family translocator [Thermocrispum municipale]